MAEASRLRSQSGRDIAPIPPVANVARRLSCRDSLLTYLQTYHRAKFKKRFSKNHISYIDILDSNLKGSGQLAIAMPRGTGKTTIAKMSAIWALLNGHKRYIVIFSATSREAEKVLKSIKSELSRNDLLLEDYPEALYPIRLINNSSLLVRGQLFYGASTSISWQHHEVIFPSIPFSVSSGSVIQALGISGAIRGAATDRDTGETIRPDSIILDDVQKPDDARNPLRVEKIEEQINSTISGLVEDGGRLSQTMCCTVLYNDDVSDRYLNHDIYPRWSGHRFRAVEKMPTRMDLWKEYRAIRFNDPEAATTFYKDHYDDMHLGAEVAWPESVAEGDLDALQTCLNRWADNERAFWSESQNDPLRPAGSEILVPAREIVKRLNSYKRGIVPSQCVRLTAAVDVHDDLLYYSVLAWEPDSTGYIIDYSTFPDQNRRWFSKSDSGLITMASRFNGSADGVLRQGLTFLFDDLVKRQYALDGAKEEYRKIDRILVDAKYKPEIVESAVHSANTSIITPCRGTSVRATNRPMSAWPRRPDRVFGHHTIEEKIDGRYFRSVLVDTNYWKSRVHEEFRMVTGEHGSLSLWGRDPTRIG